MVDILSALTAPNPKIKNHRLKPGPNTITGDPYPPVSWCQWADFKYEVLMKLFGSTLRSSRRHVQNVDLLPWDKDIVDEHTFDVLVHRSVMPVVNACLVEQPSSCYFGAGSRCINADGDRHAPDWSCASHGGTTALVLGDTKISSKWTPDLANSPPGTTGHKEWAKVLSQITLYMRSYQVRYGFIITDEQLVVLRITRERVGTGLAAHRLRRAPAVAVSYAPQAAGAAAAAAATAAFYDDSAGNISGLSDTFANTTASYDDSATTSYSIYPPEYALIPWTSHGPGKLTVKLALWCLAMMAGNGDGHVDYSYPYLDSWREVEGGYFHNTKGVFKSRLRPGASIQNLDPAQVYANESAAMWPSNAGAGTQEEAGEEVEEEGEEEEEEEEEEEQEQQEEESDDNDNDDDDDEEQAHFSETEEDPGEGPSNRRVAPGLFEEGDDGSETAVEGPPTVHVDIQKSPFHGWYFRDAHGNKQNVTAGAAPPEPAKSAEVVAEDATTEAFKYEPISRGTPRFLDLETEELIPPHLESSLLIQQRIRSRHKPFLSNVVMGSRPLRCWRKDFSSPRLRKCAFDLASIDWTRSRPIGAGVDGHVWRVYFGDQGPFVLKARECQNAAVLQMMKTNMDLLKKKRANVAKKTEGKYGDGTAAAAASRAYSIMIRPNPRTEEDAWMNQTSFCTEALQIQEQFPDGLPSKDSSTRVARPKLVPLEDDMPRFPQCYGWVKMPQSWFENLPPGIRPGTYNFDGLRRSFEGYEEKNNFIAVVYEYIRSGPHPPTRSEPHGRLHAWNDPKEVERVDRFLYLAGFGHAGTPLARNWKNNVLVDHSDIVLPRWYGWRPEWYGPYDAERILVR
ncbi:hypothetical protein SPI_06301 [Niveomyces insectorum RCEF 264]|uniref:Uncharacterized protein n=1 Tax=Niveomyces insectorum RCEF 264 TaxID=1081102 RepID=A0A167RZX8_9HYPO|nr:hypothetical protein SPI_06301 [Niveomyces insectorum RCEF 264]